MTTRCITRVIHARARIRVSAHCSRLLASSGVAVGISPRTPESSNDEALDYCINNATNSAVSRQSPSRALTLTLSLFLFRSIQLARIGIDIISLQHPSDLGHECVYTAFDVAAGHSFSAGPLKRLKRPHDRYVIPRCSRPAVGRAEHDRRPIVIADSRFPPVVMNSYRSVPHVQSSHLFDIPTSSILVLRSLLYIARYVLVFHPARCIAQS